MIPPTRGVAKLGYDGSDLVGVGTEETFDECEFKKPNAKCPSNDPATTLREPAFLARPEDFQIIPPHFQPRGLLEKPNQIPYAHFERSV